jgi:hypothetical protein
MELPSTIQNRSENHLQQDSLFCPAFAIIRTFHGLDNYDGQLVVSSNIELVVFVAHPFCQVLNLSFILLDLCLSYDQLFFATVILITR